MMECNAKVGRGRARGMRPLTLETLKNMRKPLPHAATGPAAQWATRRPGYSVPAVSDECPVQANNEKVIEMDISPEPLQSNQIDEKLMEVDTPTMPLRVQKIEIIDSSDDEQDNDNNGNQNEDVIITRPQLLIESKKGVNGKPITLKSNHFKLIAPPDWCLHKYHVRFEPEEPSIVMRKALVGLHQKSLGGYVFNGTIMYSNQRLPNDLTELVGVRQADKKAIQIFIQFVGIVEKQDHIYTQFFNVLLQKSLNHLNLLFVGENIFDPSLKIDINEHNIELWPGYNKTINQYEKDVLMCADVTYKIVRKESMLMTLNRIKETYSSEDFKAACHIEMIDTTVWTDYNKKAYKILDINFSMNPLSKFQTNIQEEEGITFFDYYKKKYNILIEDLKQPLLVTSSSEQNSIKSNDIVYLVPELCRAIGLSDEMKSDPKLMEVLADQSRLPVDSLTKKLLTLSQLVNKNPLAVGEFDKWQLKLDQELVKIPARILSNSKIIFADHVSIEVSGLDPNLNWSNYLQIHGLFHSVLLNNWVVIVPKRLAKKIREFITCMQQSMKSFQVREPHYIEIIQNTPQSYSSEIDKYLSNTNSQLVFCVMPDDSSDVYSAIKKKCYVDYGVPNQLISTRSFRLNNMAMIAAKVAIQMNCKIGGFPWSVHIPLSSLMVIGFESRRDKTLDKFFSSIVVSLDKNIGRYFSAVSSHTDDAGLLNNFVINITKAMHKFYEINDTFPEKILVYRTGVSEQQASHIFTTEIPHILLKLADIYQLPQDEIPMTYVIVNKITKTHFYAESFGRAVNPPLGTVIDDVVTCPKKYDFFITGQSSRRGSATPTLFDVIHDNMGLQPDKLQLLTYRLMHMNFNLSFICYIPGPLQFARKLLKLVCDGIHCEPNPQLGSTLYFL